MTKYKLTCGRSTFVALAEEHIVGPRAKRNREILYDCKLDGLTYEQVAEKYGMSTRQIGQVVTECMKVLMPYLPQ